MTAQTEGIEGWWDLLKAEMEGEAAPELVVRKTRLRLSEGAYQVFFDGVVTDRGTYEAGLQGEVKTLHLRGVEGPNAGRTLPCVFQLVGDRLRVCYGLDGVLPARFTAQAGEGRYLATYRRVSADSTGERNTPEDES